MTKRFVFDLDEPRREKLEAYRAKMGLRSLAAALQSLIDNADSVARERASQPAVGVVAPKSKIDTSAVSVHPALAPKGKK